jgi:small conductance mechanosensitive channel
MPDFQPVQALAEQIVLFLPQLGAAVLIFVVFWLVSAIFGAVVRRYGQRVRLDEELRDLFVRLFRLAILAIGLITALGTVGVDVSAMVAGLGLTSFALGFALQDIIKNTLAGVLILMYRPFRRGNYIRVGDKDGIVTDIDLRYTTLQREGIKILIPNANMFTEAITIINQPPAQPQR